MSEYIVYKSFLHYLLAMKENDQEKLALQLLHNNSLRVSN